MPSAIESVQRRFKARGLTVLAVNIRESKTKVSGWTQTQSLSIPVLLDADRAVANAYRVNATPTVFIVGRDGQLVGTARGTREWASDAGIELFEALLGR